MNISSFEIYKVLLQTQKLQILIVIHWEQTRALCISNAILFVQKRFDQTKFKAAIIPLTFCNIQTASEQKQI